MVVVFLVVVAVGIVVLAGTSVIPFIIVPFGYIHGDQVPEFRSGLAAGSKPGKLGFMAVKL